MEPKTILPDEPGTLEEREQLGKEFVKDIQSIVRVTLLKGEYPCHFN
jgi:hypothetical protein